VGLPISKRRSKAFDAPRCGAFMAIGSRRRRKSPQLARFIAAPTRIPGTVDDLRHGLQRRQHRLATYGALR
jgi:hypothetical protein